jgi:HK97 family phage portal protein
MGIIDSALRMFGLQSKSSQTVTYREAIGWDGWARGLAQISAAGETVSRETALTVTAVLSACRVNAEAIGMLPLCVQQNHVALPDHPLWDILEFEPNPFQSSFGFREMLQYHLELYWDAFIWVVRSADGRILELYPLPPEWVEVRREKDWSLTYFVTLNQATNAAGVRIQMDPTSIVHIAGASWDGVEGMDAIKTIRNAIGLSLAAERHASGMFKNGAQLSGILNTDAVLSPEVVDRLKAQWSENYGGAANAYRTPVLEQGLTWNPVSMNAVDSQLIEARKFQIEEVARWTKTPAPLLGAGEKMQAYASVEQMMLFWLNHGIMPRCKRWESTLNKRLLSKEDRRNGIRIAFDTSELSSGDMSTMSNFYSKALGSGGSPPWMVVNEVRQKMRLPKRMEPWADELARGTNPTAGGEDENAPSN